MAVDRLAPGAVGLVRGGCGQVLVAGGLVRGGECGQVPVAADLGGEGGCDQIPTVGHLVGGEL